MSAPRRVAIKSARISLPAVPRPMVILRRKTVPTVPVLTLSKPAGLASPVIINPEVLASQTIRTVTPARQAIRAALVLLRRNRKERPQKFALADKNLELATNAETKPVPNKAKKTATDLVLQPPNAVADAKAGIHAATEPAFVLQPAKIK